MMRVLCRTFFNGLQVARIYFDIYLKYPQGVTRDRTFIRTLVFLFTRHNYFWIFDY